METVAQEIPLTQGKVALVDAADYERLSQYHWSAAKAANSDIYYALRTVIRGSRKTTVAMHREILNAPDGMEVDHKDCDGLNNCRSNLRLATGTQNRRNRRVSKSANSGYKGIWQCRGRWGASITHERKKIHLGLYVTPELAARAYDIKAVELYGEFARTNFADIGPPPKRGTSTRKPSSSYPGVSYCASRDSWETSIKVKGKKHFIGRFKTEKAAAKAYAAKAQELLARTTTA